MGNTDLFEVLVGNRQMESVADSRTIPIAQLHVFPNFLESTRYLLTIPMTRGPLNPFCTATRRGAFVSTSAGPSALRTFLSRVLWGREQQHLSSKGAAPPNNRAMASDRATPPIRQSTKPPKLNIGRMERKGRHKRTPSTAMHVPVEQLNVLGGNRNLGTPGPTEQEQRSQQLQSWVAFETGSPRRLRYLAASAVHLTSGL